MIKPKNTEKPASSLSAPKFNTKRSSKDTERQRNKQTTNQSPATEIWIQRSKFNQSKNLDYPQRSDFENETKKKKKKNQDVHKNIDTVRDLKLGGQGRERERFCRGFVSYFSQERKR